MHKSSVCSWMCLPVLVSISCTRKYLKALDKWVILSAATPGGTKQELEYRVLNKTLKHVAKELWHSEAGECSTEIGRRGMKGVYKWAEVEQQHYLMKYLLKAINVIWVLHILVKSLCARQHIYVPVVTLCFMHAGWVSLCSDITDVYKLCLSSKLFIMWLQTASALFQHG